jgi:hypothetical protein
LNMAIYTPADSLHRLVKQVLDSGAAASLEEAEALFRDYQLVFAIDAEGARSAAHQAALLTGIALARRVFLGGVAVTGPLDAPLIVPTRLGGSLREAVEALGGTIAMEATPNAPLISIGGARCPRASGFHVRTTFSGWRGGIVPAHAEHTPSDPSAMPLAPMLAGALAVSEAFFFIRGEAGWAGRRATGLSLWRPESADWLGDGGSEPRLRLLPSKLWLIGLGHLGQAYLWALGLLPYPQPTGLELVLQDVDVVTPSSESTSILTDLAMTGQKKTRAMAAWAERQGFATRIHERLFDADLRRQDVEPAVALCGLDNAMGRRALDQVGFSLVVEAGLGHGFRDFRSMRLHTLPGSRSAAEIWKAPTGHEDVTDRAAYRKLLSNGELDLCGVTLLAGKAVGAPFVGSVAACLAVSEILRLLHDGQINQVIDLDLKGLEYRTVVPQQRDFNDFNPGYVVTPTA